VETNEVASNDIEMNDHHQHAEVIIKEINVKRCFSFEIFDKIPVRQNQPV
jgi:hypothetical protein